MYKMLYNWTFSEHYIHNDIVHCYCFLVVLYAFAVLAEMEMEVERERNRKIESNNEINQHIVE